MIIAAYQHRIAEIRQTVNANEKECAGQSRRSQTQRHRPEKIPSSGSQILSGQLQIRTNGFQYTGNRNVCQREKSNGLSDPESDRPIQIRL